MKRRKVIIAVIVATVGLGVAALPAAAELHSVTVVLVTGQRITKTVDIAPGTPASQIVVPGITGAIAQIIDNGPINVPTPTGTPLPAPTVPAVPTVPGTKPKPKATPTPDGNDKPGRAEPQPGRLRPGGRRRSRRGNQKFKAGNLNSKKLVSELKRQAKKKARRQGSRARDRRHPDARQPDLLARAARRGPDRRPELLHRQVPDPAVPAPALPGRRHRVRRALGGPGGDQRDRDRLRPQPQRLLRGRARVDAVHARDVEAVRRRRQQGRPEGPVQPGRRDLRHRPLPQGRRRRAGPAQGDLRLQPRRLVRRLRPHARAPDRWPALELRRVAHRPDPGPLPGRRQGHLRRRLHRGRREEGQEALAQAG